jgi:hypothetical protein
MVNKSGETVFVCHYTFCMFTEYVSSGTVMTLSGMQHGTACVVNSL